MDLAFDEYYELHDDMELRIGDESHMLSSRTFLSPRLLMDVFLQSTPFGHLAGSRYMCTTESSRSTLI
jgi:hypothetical protein